MSYCDFTLIFFSLTGKIGDISIVRSHHRNLNDCVMLNSIQEEMIWGTMLWFGHSFVSKHLIH